jgi:hypothetical protein
MRDELYEQAKRLGIESSSKMNKAELERAVASKKGRSSRTRSRESDSVRSPELP